MLLPKEAFDIFFILTRFEVVFTCGIDVMVCVGPRPKAFS
jgi:hypothetical protein